MFDWHCWRQITLPRSVGGALVGVGSARRRVRVSGGPGCLKTQRSGTVKPWTSVVLVQANSRKSSPV